MSARFLPAPPLASSASTVTAAHGDTLTPKVNLLVQ